MNGRRCGVRARDWEAVAENSKEGVVKEGGTRMQIDSFSVSFFPSFFSSFSSFLRFFFFSSLSFLTFLLSYRRYNVLVVKFRSTIRPYVGDRSLRFWAQHFKNTRLYYKKTLCLCRKSIRESQMITCCLVRLAPP